MYSLSFPSKDFISCPFGWVLNIQVIFNKVLQLRHFFTCFSIFQQICLDLQVLCSYNFSIFAQMGKREIIFKCTCTQKSMNFSFCTFYFCSLTVGKNMSKYICLCFFRQNTQQLFLSAGNAYMSCSKQY